MNALSQRFAHHPAAFPVTSSTLRTDGPHARESLPHAPRAYPPSYLCALRVIAIFLASLSLCVTTSQAANDGHALLRQCTEAIKIMDGVAGTSSIDFGQAGHCMGAVDGFAGATAFYERRPGAPRAICLPENGTTIGQSVRVVEKYLRAHPEQLHESSTVLLFGAFLASYPCPR